MRSTPKMRTALQQMLVRSQWPVGTSAGSLPPWRLGSRTAGGGGAPPPSEGRTEHYADDQHQEEEDEEEQEESQHGHHEAPRGDLLHESTQYGTCQNLRELLGVHRQVSDLCLTVTV